MIEQERVAFIGQVMHKLTVVYHRQNSAELANVYFDILRPFSMEDILGAVHVWMSNQDKWPAPVNLLETVRVIVNRRPHADKVVEPDMIEEEKTRCRVSFVLFKWLWLPVRIDVQIARMKSMAGDREQVESWWMKEVDRLLDSPDVVATMAAEVEASKAGFAVLLNSCQQRRESHGRVQSNLHGKKDRR
jgi:hypothetical protein